MNLYAHDLSILDFNYGLTDSTGIGEPLSHRFLPPNSLFRGEDDDYRRNITHYDRGGFNGGESVPRREISPQHRHDGKSPLPLGMDWSAPPRKWEGPKTVWPQDPQTGWSYCVTVPSWIHTSRSNVSDPAVFYRVQVALQSPEGISAAKLIHRRFSDFLDLYSSIKKEFPKKRLPHAPPKKILRMKSQTLLEERRCFLEGWMNTLLSDIDISRSAPVATFLELEAAVRSYFNDDEQENEDSNPHFYGDVLTFLPNTSSDASLLRGSSSVTSDHVNETPDDTSSDLATPKNDKDSLKALVSQNSASEENVTDWHELIKKYGLLDKNLGSDDVGPSNLVRSLDSQDGAHGDTHGVVDDDIKSPNDQIIAFHSIERQRLNRVIDTLKQRLETAKADMEDLITRLKQEDAVRQFMSTKIKDLEVELETTRESCKLGMEQTVVSEKERFTQIQWDMEELRKSYMEIEYLFNSTKDEKHELEMKNECLVRENEVLLQQMNDLRDNLESFRKEHEELEVKSKADLKVLVKEVKSLRNFQSDLKQEISRLMKENVEHERIAEKEKQRAENSKKANEKLVRECDVLRNQLLESAVDFLVEDNGEVIVETSYPSDAIDQLEMSDNRIGLLLAETQLLGEDVEEEEDDEYGGRREEGVRKMVREVLMDNARLRKQINSVLRCVLSATETSKREEEEEKKSGGVATTVLSKIMEK